MNRFFLPPENFDGKGVFFDPETSHQIKHVLRLKPGGQVLALDGSGKEFLVELELVDKDNVRGKILSGRVTDSEPAICLTLLVGLTQREKFEWVLQKCTEVGVKAFTPVITSRSLVQDIRSAEQKVGRWQSILKEAAEQSGRGMIPELNPPVLFLQALEQLRAFDLGMIAYEGEDRQSLGKAVKSFRGKSIGVLIGPEGGLSPEEVQRGKQAGIQVISMGRRILRMETAAVVSAALILHDLKSLG